MPTPTVTTQNTSAIGGSTATGHGATDIAEINKTESASFGTGKLITNNPPRAESIVITNV